LTSDQAAISAKLIVARMAPGQWCFGCDPQRLEGLTECRRPCGGWESSA